MTAHIPKDPNATASYTVASNASSFDRVALWGEAVEAESDMPPTLLQTIQQKIASGEDEGVDESVFRQALDHSIFPE